jgi:phage recombination protein Bet
MTAVTTLDWNAKQLDLIRRTVAKDCDVDEFNLFIHTAKHLRLDPLRRQIYAFVFNKNDPKKRQMTIVVSILGYRTIAARTGNYRPDNKPARLTYDESKIGPTNPTGLVEAEVSVFMRSHGEWHEIVGTARWDEYVPTIDEWRTNAETGEREPSGKSVIDRKKSGWVKMPTIMLAKVAETAALRRAWPDDFSGVYVEEEIDRTHTLDLSASELADMAGVERRAEKIGGLDGIMLDVSTPNRTVPLIAVQPGQFHARVDEFLAANAEEPSVVMMFKEKNHRSLQYFWALDPNAALDLKKKFEQVEKVYQSELAEPQALRAAAAASEEG